VAQATLAPVTRSGQSFAPALTSDGDRAGNARVLALHLDDARGGRVLHHRHVSRRWSSTLLGTPAHKDYLASSTMSNRLRHPLLCQGALFAGVARLIWRGTCLGTERRHPPARTTCSIRRAFYARCKRAHTCTNRALRPTRCSLVWGEVISHARPASHPARLIPSWRPAARGTSLRALAASNCAITSTSATSDRRWCISPAVRSPVRSTSAPATGRPAMVNRGGGAEVGAPRPLALRGAPLPRRRGHEPQRLSCAALADRLATGSHRPGPEHSRDDCCRRRNPRTRGQDAQPRRPPLVRSFARYQRQESVEPSTRAFARR